jgi:opacity protein-like surface antigen
MKHLLTILTLTCFAGVGMAADDFPQADLFLGYSFLRANSAQNIPAFTANGGIGTFAWNFTRHFAMEGELGGYHNGNVNNHQFDTTAFSYLFGPRLSWGRGKRIDPYFHILFGGLYGVTSIAVPPLAVPPIAGTPTPTLPNRVGANQNSFAWAPGGGLDIRLTHLITLRPVQFDYYQTHFSAPDTTPPFTRRSRSQHDLRYAAGVDFNFGGAN